MQNIQKAYYNLTLKQYIEFNSIGDDWISLAQFLAGRNLTIEEAANYHAQIRILEASIPKTKPKSFYVVNRTIYKVNYKLSEVKADQFIDLIHFAAKEDSTSEIHNILAIFMRPIMSNDYEGHKHQEIANNLLSMRLEDALPIMVFFCNYLTKLYAAIPTYLKVKEANLRSFIKSGVGLQPLTV